MDKHDSWWLESPADGGTQAGSYLASSESTAMDRLGCQKLNDTNHGRYYCLCWHHLRCFTSASSARSDKKLDTKGSLLQATTAIA